MCNSISRLRIDLEMRESVKLLALQRKCQQVLALRLADTLSRINTGILLSWRSRWVLGHVGFVHYPRSLITVEMIQY